MYGGMAVVPAVLDTYLYGYKRFREQTGFTPAEQEVIFLAVSDFNGCGYCMAEHSMIADKMVPERAPAALRAGEPLPEFRCFVRRRPRCTRGTAVAAMAVRPRGDFDPGPTVEAREGGATFRLGDLTLALSVSLPLALDGEGVTAALRLAEGGDGLGHPRH